MSNDMHPDLKWLAENVSEWNPSKIFIKDGVSLIFKDGKTGMFCALNSMIASDYTYKCFTKAQWLQARKDLGLIMSDSEEELPAQEWAGSITDSEEEAEMLEDMVSDNETKRSAPDFLHQAAELMIERGKQYDQPGGERSMGKAVAALNAITGRNLTEAEGWLLMSLVKRVRQFSGAGYHKDSAEDAVAYAALEAESLEANDD